MQSSNIPGKLQIPFANAAGGAFIRPIPVASQIGILDGAASLTDGFVPLNATPIGAGGVPPSIEDMNGILFEVSGWSRWVAAGGGVYFDSAFSTAIGGYPKGAFLQSATTAGLFFVSTAENNTNNPDSVMTGWLAVIPVKASAGDVTTGTDDTKFVTPLRLAGLRASNAEVLAGSDAVKYVTPAAFYAARAASGDIQAGTDDHKYLTSLALAAATNAAFATNGGYDFPASPGGVSFKIRWVNMTAANGVTNGNWATPFASQCFAAFCNGGFALGNNQDNNPIVKTFGASSFVLNSAVSSCPVCVVGIGI